MRRLAFLLWGVFALYPNIRAQENKGDWPISGLKLVDTQWAAWVSRFFATDKKNQLYYGKLVDQKYELMRVSKFPREPDVIKHFPMEDGDLVVQVYNFEKYMRFEAFDFTGELRYSNEFALDYNVYDVDARVNVTEGNPSCLLYAYDKRNYMIKYWTERKTQNLMVSRDPIDLMFLQWADGDVHYVSSTPNGMSWTTWQKGVYKTFPLPFHIKNAKFYQYRKTMHLVGIDHEGGLWQFDIVSGTLRQNLLLRDRRLVYTDTLAVFNFNRAINVILSSSRLSSAYRVVFDDFPYPRKKLNLEVRNLFWPGRIYPIVDKGNYLNFLHETELQHIYLEAWSAPTVLISNLDWTLDIKRNPPVMLVHWSIPEGSQYAYRYLLNQEADSEPLNETKLIPTNTLQFSARKDGQYVLHLQVRNVRTGSYSRIYHIPLVWQYTPPEPRLILLNPISPRMVRVGRAEFLLRNPQHGEYYATLDSKAETIPKTLVSAASGRLSFMVRRKGLYYLHVAHRDPHSRVLSPVAHFLFFAAPFDKEEDPTLAENKKRIEEILRIKKHIEDAKGDPAATHPWINRLREIEAQIQ